MDYSKENQNWDSLSYGIEIALIPSIELRYPLILNQIQ